MIDGGIRAVFVVASLLGLWRATLSKKDVPERLAIAILPLAVAVGFIQIVHYIVSTPFWDRNASRLLGAFCLAYRFPLYTPMSGGPMLSMEYPPLAAIAYLPATIAKTPTVAILLASTLTVLYFMLPPAYLFWSDLKSRPLWAVGLFFAFVFATIRYDPLSYSGFRLHADAPALGFAAWACVVLERRQDKMGFLLSSLFAILAVWTKQTLIVLILVLPIYVFFRFGRRAGEVFLTYVAGFGLISTAVVFFFFPWRDLLWNTFLIFHLQNHPWVDSLMNESVFEGGALLVRALPLLLAWLIFREPGRDGEKLWVYVSLAMIPVALMNRAKIGGDINAFSLVLYFLAIAAFRAIAHAISAGHRPLGHVAKQALLCILVVFVVAEGLPLGIYGLGGMIHALPRNPQQVAFDYARLHPGEAYFPWNPLSHLMAERKLYHFESAQADWDLTGRPVNEKLFRTYVPSSPRIIAFHRRNEFTHELTLRWFPAYRLLESFPELPDWYVYERPKPGS